jgi:RNA polymerase sigma factor (sigma-70 family)
MQDRNRKTDRPPASPEIVALIVQGRGGDRSAMEGLIRYYQGRIAKFVLSQTGDDGHYEDLCQTIFVQMVIALPRLRSIERFESWLFQIARNACRDHLRKQRRWRKQFIPLAVSHNSVVDLQAICRDANEEIIMRGIDQLPGP